MIEQILASHKCLANAAYKVVCEERTKDEGLSF